MDLSPFDLLLEFLSAKNSGGWLDLRQAALTTVERTGEVPQRWHPTVVAENLVALANVEIAFESDLRWAVCPPVLVPVEADGQRKAVLCGARTHDLVERIEAEARQLGAEVYSSVQRLAPSRLEIMAPSKMAVEELATAINLPLHTDAAKRLLRVLPTLGSMLRAAPEVHAPTGYETYRFDPATLAWLPIDRVQDDGSYRFDCYRPEFRVVSDGVQYRVQRGVALYHALARARRNVLAYTEQGRTLTIPVQLRLPPLYTRALALCQGSAPEYDPDTRRLSFRGVEPAFAARLSRKIQSLEV